MLTNEIQDLREKISTEIANGRVLANTCRKLIENNDALRATLTETQLSLNTELLTRQSTTLKNSVQGISGSFGAWTQNIKSSFKLNTEVSDSNSSWAIGLFFSLLGLGFGFLFKSRFSHNLSELNKTSGKEPFELNLLTSINEYTPYLFAGLFGFLAFKNVTEFHQGWTLPSRILFIVLLASIVLAYFRWFCKPNSPGDELHILNKDIPKELVKRMQGITIVVALGFTVFGLQFLRGLPPQELIFPYQVLLFVLALSMLSTLKISSEFPDLKSRSRVLRTFLILATLVSLPATLFGYINAANFLICAVLVTQTAVLILRTLMWSIDATFDGIINGKSKNAYKARAMLGIRTEESSAELSWIRLFLGLFTWLFFAFIIIAVWDYTSSVIPNIQKFANEGVQIGEDSKIIPRNIIRGIIIFAFAQAFTVWLKARLEQQWLRNIGMDRGSRDALVTLTGYLGMIIAILLGLTVAGVSFSGLALVAGALSVGIGFGLQNIVNNFISGLILLFERPINNGDYITVNNVEGTVKRISIRSTEIETLNRTNIIVPNSQLISEQVTNWVLHDSNGMIHIPVGVAYGTNTDKVKELLLEVASEHSEVVTRPNMPQPKVRFNNFGDSSLDFSLVILIKNINNRFEVTSDINFLIDKKFRENNIEIPFPQRDLHVTTNEESSFLVETSDSDKNLDTDKEIE